MRVARRRIRGIGGKIRDLRDTLYIQTYAHVRLREKKRTNDKIHLWHSHLRRRRRRHAKFEKTRERWMPDVDAREGQGTVPREWELIDSALSKLSQLSECFIQPGSRRDALSWKRRASRAVGRRRVAPPPLHSWILAIERLYPEYPAELLTRNLSTVLRHVWQIMITNTDLRRPENSEREKIDSENDERGNDSSSLPLKICWLACSRLFYRLSIISRLRSVMFRSSKSTGVTK